MATIRCCVRALPYLQLSLGGLAACQLLHAGTRSDTSFRTEFILIDDFTGASLETGPGWVRISAGPQANAIDWDQVVASWNTSLGENATAQAELQPLGEGTEPRWYSFGIWSGDPSSAAQHSIPGQADPAAEMRTDTLVLTRPCRGFRFRATLRGSGLSGAVWRQLALAFSAGRPVVAEGAPTRHASWGQALAVPERCQLDYPEGGAWCSPTAVAMLAGFWSLKLRAPDLACTVPEVAAGVNDPAWPGTGNWAFNMAWAGALPGLRAQVVRLRDVADLEPWLEAGYPVAASVSYGRLKGGDAGPEDGHLVVVIGFTDTGDVLVNDPGSREQPQRRVPRAQFAAAWGVSGNTLYLVHPEGQPPPRPAGTPWRQLHFGVSAE